MGLAFRMYAPSQEAELETYSPSMNAPIKTSRLHIAYMRYIAYCLYAIYCQLHSTFDSFRSLELIGSYEGLSDPGFDFFGSLLIWSKLCCCKEGILWKLCCKEDIFGALCCKVDLGKKLGESEQLATHINCN